MSKFISKQKFSFHNGVEEFILPLGGDGVEVPKYVQENFLFRMALKAGTIVELADKKAEAPKAEAPKADAPKADAPKADAPKADAPKADAPKADAPKAKPEEKGGK